MKTLDKYDCKLIQCFKSNRPYFYKIKEIWADRCGIHVEHVELMAINCHLLDLSRQLDLFSDYTFKGFILSLNPQKNYYYTCSSKDYLKEDTTDYQLILLSRLDSLFSLTESAKLPGYKEWVENNK